MTLPMREQLTYISLSKIPSTTANSMQVMKMCQAFLQEGVGVTLYAPAQDHARQITSLLDWYGLEEEIPIIRVSGNTRLRGHWYRVKAISMARANDTPLVFTRDIAIAALATGRGLPTLLEMHDVPSTPANRFYFRTALRSRHLIRVIPISKALEEALLMLPGSTLERSRTRVLPDGVDLERFNTRPSKEQAKDRLNLGDRPVIGYVGHLYRGRGMETMLELTRHLNDCLFLIVGGTAEMIQGLKNSLAENNAPNVRVEGFIENRYLPTYLAACDALLMPYEKRVSVGGGGDTSRFMSPMKMFEYMASGVPIIASDLPVLREVLNEKNCLFCRVGDTDDWVEKIRWAVENPMEVMSLGSQARLDVRAYSWRVRARTIIKDLRNELTE